MSAKKEIIGCNIRNEDKWDPVKWLSYAKGTFFEWLIPQHEFEQLVVNRYFNEGCGKCVENGCCTNCGCATYAKMLDNNASCSSGHWAPYMSERQWGQWKTMFKINVSVVKK